MKKSRNFSIKVLFLTTLLLGSLGCNNSEEKEEPAAVHQEVTKKEITEKHAGVQDDSKWLWVEESDPKFKIIKTGSQLDLIYLGAHSEQKRIADIHVFKKGTKAYRWVDQIRAKRVDHNGHIDAEEIDQNVNRNDWQEQGGGIYASTNPYDTKIFGNELLIIEAQKDLFLVNSTLLHSEPVLDYPKPGNGRSTDEWHRAKVNWHKKVLRGLRSIGIHGVYDGTFEENNHSFWVNFIHPEALSLVLGESHPWMKGRVELMTRFFRLKELTKEEEAELPGNLEEIKKETYYYKFVN